MDEIAEVKSFEARTALLNWKIPAATVILGAMALLPAVPFASGAELKATPSTFQKLLSALKPGDTMNLEPGQYPPLAIAKLNGEPDAWITIKGPATGKPAAVVGEIGSNTIEIVNSSFLAIENLRIDSRGIPGAFGISAKGGERNHTHDIRIEGNTLVGQNGNQQTDGISTKIPTWGWIIRNNQILGAGTGIYLGNSDGTDPFVSGLIEHNLVKDTIGYNMEIKDQFSIPAVPGMPLKSSSTIIRDNVFIKDDSPSPDGDRPNLLVGAFPETGIGFLNLYEIYGNFFYHNHREALFQGSGRVSLHDNIFVDGPLNYSAVELRRQNFPLKLAYVYNNTVYTQGRGISFGTPAVTADAVTGNLVFASDPITGPIGRLSNNLAAPFASALGYVNLPSFELGSMDFYPRTGKCQGPTISLIPFHSDADYNLDFNGTPKNKAKGAPVFRGAYSGSGTNPGWQLQAAIKPPRAPSSETAASGYSGTVLDQLGRVDSFETADSTETKQSSAAYGETGFTNHRAGDCCYRPADAYAAGVLLWQPTAGAQFSATQ